MAVDFGNTSKTGSVYPISAVDTSGNFDRIEPLITPDILKEDWLFAVPLFDPKTQTRITNDMLKRIIIRATSQLELDLKINIAPVRRKVKLAYDRNLARYFNHLEVPYKPINTLLGITIEDSNYNTIYTFPPAIIETRNMWQGQINFGPITQGIQSGTILNNGSYMGGNGLLLIENCYMQSAPAFWVVDCITGFPENGIPTVINELIGITAAIEVLSKIQVLFKTNSQSLSHDGISQSTSGPGPQVFANRINDLKEKKAAMLDQVRHQYYNSVFVSNI